MIRLADEALGRRGRMVRAIECIGRGVLAGRRCPSPSPPTIRTE